MIIVQCPECKDSVRLPRSSASLDIEVRCPLCGFSNTLGEFARQLPPELEIIEAIERGNVGDAQWPMTDLKQGESAGDALVIDFSSSSGGTLEPSDRNVADPMDFAAPAGEIQTKRIRRRNQSVFKMLFQWFGGGAMGIGIALGILYFWFPDRFYEFFPGARPQRETRPGGSNDEFIPRSVGREAGSDTFLPRGQDGDLLQSMALPTGVEVAEEAIDQQAPPKDLEDKSPAEPIDPFGRLVEKASNALAAIKANPNAPDQKTLTTRLCQAISDLGELVGSEPSATQVNGISRLLSDIADGDQWQALALQTSDWLSSDTLPRNAGIFIAAQIGNQITVQKDPELASVPINWKDQEALPITIYGDTDELTSHQGKRTIIIGVIERERDDITGSGKLIRAIAIHPLETQR